jgi:hypothetical protein
MDHAARLLSRELARAAGSGSCDRNVAEGSCAARHLLDCKAVASAQRSAPRSSASSATAEPRRAWFSSNPVGCIRRDWSYRVPVPRDNAAAG